LHAAATQCAGTWHAVRLRSTPLRSATDGSRFGGKAAGLAALIQWGFPVPDGVAVDPDTAAAIAEGIERLSIGIPEPWAVRSSAIGEDGAHASYAGQHDSVLDLGRSSLSEAVRTVVESGGSERAEAYARERGLPARSRMAVVVQRFVRADVSGVAFGINPVTGARESVIEAVRGSGEALVGGLVTPDYWSVDGEIVREYHPGSIPVGWSDADVRLVARTVKSVSRSAGRPMDIEFAHSDGKLWLLQARPVTT
jgi:pyruvate,water dikinase